MEVEFAMLADYAASTSDGKLVIGGIFDSIYAAELPVSHPLMAMAIRIRAHPGEEGLHDVKVRLVDPDGREVIDSLDAPLELDGLDPVDGGSTDMVLQMAGVPFTAFGRHSFDVFVDGRFERSVTLSVRQALQQAPPAGDET